MTAILVATFAHEDGGFSAKFRQCVKPDAAGWRETGSHFRDMLGYEKEFASIAQIAQEAARAGMECGAQRVWIVYPGGRT